MGRVNIILKDDLHRQVKSACALRGETLGEYIRTAVVSKLRRLH